MHVGVLKTDGGPHSAETWAGITASQIIEIAPTVSAADESHHFKSKLVALLTKLHDRVQKSERNALEKKPAHLLADMNLDDLDAAVDAIVDLAGDTSFADHFAKTEVQVYVARVLRDHFHTSMNIERSWHADRNPDDDHSKAFRAMFHGVSAVASNTPEKKEDK